MKRIRAFLEFLGAFLLIFVLLFSIASLVIVKFYGDQVQQFALESINRQLDTKVSTEEIGISIFKDFPNTSVFLNNVSVWSGHSFNREEFEETETDLLLEAERIYVQFNLIQLIRKDFRIKGLELRSARCVLLSDSNGGTNYHIISQANEKDEEGKGQVQLKNVVLKDVELIYLNRAKQIASGIHVEHLLFDGNFGKDHFDMKSKGSVMINSIQNQGITYLKNERLKSDLSVEVKENHFSISKGMLELAGMKSNIEGEFIIDRGIGTDLMLTFQGDRMNLGMVTDLLETIAPEAKIQSSGYINISGSINGLLSSTITPHIELSFQGTGASLVLPGVNEKLKNIHLTGAFSNGHLNHSQSSVLSIKALETSFLNSRLKCSMRLENFSHPSITGDIQGSVEVIDMMTFLPELPVLPHSGKILPKISFQAKIPSFQSDFSSISLDIQGSIDYSELQLSFMGNGLRLDSCRGSIDLGHEKWALYNEMKICNSQLTMELESSNPINKSSEALILRGNISGMDMDLNEILDKIGKDKKAKEGKANISFPSDIQAEIDFSFKDILIGEIEARRFNGTFNYRAPSLSFYPIYLETLEGSMNSHISLSNLDKELYQTEIKAHLRNLDISELFSSFNNFGQDFFSSENIAGKISGEVNFKSSIASDFSIRTEDIESRSDVVISKGELINFEPVVELSKFLKIDKMDRIEFSTIHNTIEIKDNEIQIPQMDIESSVFSLQASGNHRFNKTFEYHLGVRLSELLFNKAKSSKKQEFEVAIDPDDQRRIFLLIYDEGEGLMVDFDEDQAMKKIRSDFKEEKTELKVILNEEFGFFKKDSSVIDQSEKHEEPKFRFDFDEDEGVDSASVQEEKPKWWKRTKSEDKKEEFEYVIEMNPN